MDIDKLIEAVRLCGSSPTIYQCEACAYYTGGDMGACIPEMTAQAADALSALRSELEQVEQERDVAYKLLSHISGIHLPCLTSTTSAAGSALTQSIASRNASRSMYSAISATSQRLFRRLAG